MTLRISIRLNKTYFRIGINDATSWGDLLRRSVTYFAIRENVKGWLELRDSLDNVIDLTSEDIAAYQNRELFLCHELDPLVIKSYRCKICGNTNMMHYCERGHLLAIHTAVFD